MIAILDFRFSMISTIGEEYTLHTSCFLDLKNHDEAMLSKCTTRMI